MPFFAIGTVFQFLFAFMFAVTTIAAQSKEMHFYREARLSDPRDSVDFVEGAHFVVLNGVKVPFYTITKSQLSSTSRGTFSTDSLKIGSNVIKFKTRVQNNGRTIGTRSYELFLEKTDGQGIPRREKIAEMALLPGHSHTATSTTITLSLDDIDPELAKKKRDELAAAEKKKKDEARRQLELQKDNRETERKKGLPHGYCVPGDTMVLLPDGDTQPIEDITVGTEVVTVSATHGTDIGKVIARTERTVQELLVFNADGEEVRSTEDHPFLVLRNGKLEFVPAGELNSVSDQLLSVEKGLLPFTDLHHESLAEPVKVYNLHVLPHHNFAITEAGIVVHNCDLFNCASIHDILETAQDMYTKFEIGAGASCILLGVGCVGGLATRGDQVIAAGACPAAMPLCELAVGSAAAAAGTGLLSAWHDGVFKSETLDRGDGDKKHLPQKSTNHRSVSDNSKVGIRRSTGPVFKTNREAISHADQLGFEMTSERIKGQIVFKRGNEYITRDVDGHNGGAWKMARSVMDLLRKETRLGTYDVNLNRIGD